MRHEKLILQNDGDRILETPPIRDQIADILRRMIMKGELKTGEQISERYLSQLFEISTTPIKEALRILQAEGLVHTKPRAGTFVADVKPSSIYEIVTMRGALEGVAANLAAQNCTQDEITQMTGLLDEVESQLETNPKSDGIAKINAQFHSVLRQSSRNGYLVNLIRNMNSIDRTIRTLSFEVQNAQREARVAYMEHRAILDAVKSRDAELSERLMNDHIRRVGREVTRTT